MTELETSRSPSSLPPPSGLVAHTRLERARQLLRTGLDQLCGQFESSDDEPPKSRPSIEVQVAMVGQLLRRQLEYDEKQLRLIAFPAMDDLDQHHNALLGKLSDVERALAGGDGFERILCIAADLHRYTSQYFEWLDGFFGKLPRGNE